LVEEMLGDSVTDEQGTASPIKLTKFPMAPKLLGLRTRLCSFRHGVGAGERLEFVFEDWLHQRIELVFTLERGLELVLSLELSLK
jgi:hypothetical protein